VSMMIDPAGKPYEIAVVESSGHQAVDKVAIDLASKITYKPATHEGEPIDASFKMKFKFSQNSEARRAFLKRFMTYTRAVNDKDQKRADELLTQLQPTNLSEQAYENIARYYYARVWGTDDEERAYLRQAIAGETEPRILPKDMYVGVLYSQFNLQVKAEDFGGALWSWGRLKSLAPRDMRKKLQVTVDEIEAIRKSDRTVHLAGQVGGGASWFGSLFKDRFRIAVTSGRVAEIKLRCQKQYVFYRYQEGVTYKIDPAGGICGIEVTGDPETQFELIQT
jgi:TonB family protein